MRPIAWEDIPEEQLNELIARRVLHTANMTHARLRLSAGAVVPLHHHTNEQITTVQSGKLVFRMGSEEITVGEGEMLVLPPDLPHEVTALEDSIATDYFAPPREDWIRGDDAYLRRSIK